MTTRRITDSSIGAGGGGAVVRFQDDEPTAIRPGELWVESDGTASLINANDYLTKVDAIAEYLTKLSASATYATQTSLTDGLGSKVDYPSGGSNGDVLVKDGTSAKWDSQLGYVLIDTASFSAVSNISINGCFTNAYRNYMVIARNVPSTNNETYFRLRAGGVDTVTNYFFTYVRGQNTSGTPSTTALSGTDRFTVSINESGQPSGFILHLLEPAVASQTVLTGTNHSRPAISSLLLGGVHAFNSSFDGFSMVTSGGTFDGHVSVYGMKE